MSIFEVIRKIKNEYNSFKTPFLMPRYQKELLKEALLKQLEGKKDFYETDEKGNNLLHYLFKIIQPDLTCIDIILKKTPELLDKKNTEGKSPCDILWETEKESRHSNRPLKALLYRYTKNEDEKERLNREANISVLEQLGNEDKNTFQQFKYFSVKDCENLFKRPTLLCFPGRYASNYKEANSFGNFIRKILYIKGIDTPHIQILSTCYPGNSLDLGNDLYAFMSPYIEFDDDSPFFYIKRFVETVFRPLYTDSETGGTLPKMQAAKNMRMVNLFGYSYGASVIQMIANELSKDMNQVGYCAKDIAFIQSQICVLTVGYYGNVNNYKNHFKSHHLLHKEDKASFDTLSAAIEKKEFNKLGFYISQLKHQPNQKIYILNNLNLDCILDPHNIKNYFETQHPCEKHDIMIFWKDSILINALNNSIWNSKTDELIPLPNNLDILPEHVDYLSSSQEEIILTKLRQKSPLVKKISKHNEKCVIDSFSKIKF